MIAGLGFGGFLVLIDRVSPHAVYWPLVAGRLVSSSIAFAIVLTSKQMGLPQGRRLLLTVLVASVLDVAGNICFVLARQAGRLDIAAVLSSQYPAVTIIMARFILKERMSRVQMIGIVVALTAIALIAIRQG